MKLKVCDLMSRSVISLLPDEPVHRASAKLIELKVSALPVVDEEGQLVGIFSQYDQLQTLFHREMRDRPVSECMTCEVFTLSACASWIDVTDAFLERRLRHVPVLRHGKLVGVITRGDLIKAMDKLSRSQTIPMFSNPLCQTGEGKNQGMECALDLCER